MSTDLDAPTIRDGKPRSEPTTGIAPGTAARTVAAL
jgi:hypothetical protein